MGSEIPGRAIRAAGVHVLVMTYLLSTVIFGGGGRERAVYTVIKVMLNFPHKINLCSP